MTATPPVWEDVDCAVCDRPFTELEWDVRHSAADGADVHADCCTLCEFPGLTGLIGRLSPDEDVAETVRQLIVEDRVAAVEIPADAARLLDRFHTEAKLRAWWDQQRAPVVPAGRLDSWVAAVADQAGELLADTAT